MAVGRVAKDVGIVRPGRGPSLNEANLKQFIQNELLEPRRLGV